MKTAWGFVEAVSENGIKIPWFWCRLAERETEKELQDMIKYKDMGRGCPKIIINDGEEPQERYTFQRSKIG